AQLQVERDKYDSEGTSSRPANNPSRAWCNLAHGWYLRVCIVKKFASEIVAQQRRHDAAIVQMSRTLDGAREAETAARMREAEMGKELAEWKREMVEAKKEVVEVKQELVVAKKEVA